jgi:hypothetical protein
MLSSRTTCDRRRRLPPCVRSQKCSPRCGSHRAAPSWPGWTRLRRGGHSRGGRRPWQRRRRRVRRCAADRSPEVRPPLDRCSCPAPERERERACERECEREPARDSPHRYSDGTESHRSCGLRPVYRLFPRRGPWQRHPACRGIQEASRRSRRCRQGGRLLRDRTPSRGHPVRPADQPCKRPSQRPTRAGAHQSPKGQADICSPRQAKRHSQFHSSAVTLRSPVTSGPDPVPPGTRPAGSGPAVPAGAER